MEYRKNLLNKDAVVLFENEIGSSNTYFGRDEFFNSVIVKSDVNLIGKIKKVKIQKVNQNTLFGKILKKININNEDVCQRLVS